MYVVGIGASAGGLEALEHFFREMPGDTGACFVVVQHLSPDFKSLMKELLEPHVKMPVMHIQDGMQPQADTIYLLSAGQVVTLEGEQLNIEQREAQSSPHLPINRFFVSMAREFGPRSVAVVLSGTGSDGTKGVRAVHEAGGLVMVQSRSSAQFDGMPQSAISTGVVDHVASPWEMPRYLQRHLHPFQLVLEDDEARDEETQALQELVRIMDRRYGLDFSQYKLPGVRRRLQRRMDICQVSGLEQFVQLLREDEQVADALYRDLLIDVTAFFRDEEMFRELDRLLPDLFEAHKEKRPLRIWSTACANGAEAYSLAILFHEHAERLGWPKEQIQIFGTDVHRGAMEMASLGQFRPHEVTGLSPERLERFFKLDEGVYTARPWLRHMMIFAHHNLLRDPPFMNMDLVSCRNMLIYLQPEAQLQVLSSLSFSLRKKGLLVLGKSEHLGSLESQYSPVSKAARIFRLQESGVRPNRVMPTSAVSVLSRARNTIRGGRGANFSSDVRVQRAYDALLQRFVPSGFLVDGDMQLVHVFGDAGRYLRHTAGRVSNEVSARLIHGLSIPVSTALQRASRDKEEVLFTSLRLLPDTEQEQTLSLRVTPLSGVVGEHVFYLVSIEPQEVQEEPIPEVLQEKFDVDQAARQKLEDLQYELRHAREHLQATVEELGASNEELQATNEEMVVSNEELQSTNEELHSVNEELYTVNAEYQRKIEELTELNTDLNNLLRSSQVGIIFLDMDMRVRKFTDSATECFYLMPQDIGRSLHHLAPLVDCVGLFHDLKRVLRREEPEVRREVRHKQKPITYQLRILPYLDDLERIEGAVLIFNDVTNLKEIEENLQQAHHRLEAQAGVNQVVLEALVDRVYFYDRQGRLIYVNPSALRSLGLERPELALGKSLDELGVPEATVRDFMPRLQEVFEDKQSRQVLASYTTRQNPNQGFFDYTLSPVFNADGEVESVVTVARDVTVDVLRRRREVETREGMRAFLEELPLPTAYVSSRRVHAFANRAYRDLTGASAGDPLQEVMGEEMMTAALPSVLEALSGERASFAATGRLGARARCIVRGHCLPYTQGFDEGGFLLVLEDFTQERRAQEEEKTHQAQRQRAQKMESLGVLAGGIAHDFNNMLSIVLGNTALLKSAKDLGEIKQPLLDIQATTQRAAELCNQMLTYSGQTELHQTSTNLNERVTGLVDLMEVSLPKGVQLKLVLHPSLPTVWADKTQVDQILLNLVTNAAQAMAQKSGEVKVSTQVVALPPEFCAQYRYHPSLEPGPYAMLEVQDQGTGIADDLQEKIFEPFVSEKGEGHGLGLATVFSIVHNHNGALEVESQEGQGSTFRVYLPLQPEEVGQSAGAKPQAPEVEASAPRTEPAPPTTEQVAPPREVEGGADKATGRGLVLCADDEPALLRLEKIVLERVGFEVITALDGQELLAAFQEHHDRLVGVVMDVTMPIHDGIQCKKEIRLVEPELPIVLTSGYMDSELVDEFQDDPHCSFLQKPWGPEKLLLALRIFVPRP